MSTYFFVNPFELPYWSYDIHLEFVDKSSIISYFPSTFCPTLGHHQGRMYYKSDVTFVYTLLLWKKKTVCTVVLCSVYFSNLFYKLRQWLKTFKCITTVFKINSVKFRFYVPNILEALHIRNIQPKLDVANVLDRCLEVSELELQSCYYVHFWKKYELSYLPSNELNSISSVFLQDGFSIK